MIGETTGGGAHTVAGRRLNDHFAIGVPSGRPINAVTNSNWEGVGAEPDIKVSAESAFKVAHLMALERQQQTLTAETPGLRNEVERTLRSLHDELGDLAVSFAAAAHDGVKPVAASKANDDFESGHARQLAHGPAWIGRLVHVYERQDRAQPQPERPVNPVQCPHPPARHAAVTDTNGPGRRILYRDITLDGRYRLHLTVFYVNFGSFSAAPTSAQATISDEQQYRIDLVSASAPVDSLAPEHVLATIFQGQPGDPATRAPGAVTFDLSPWAGQTVRLRLAAADNQGPLRASVDDIRFERLGQ